MIPIFKIFFKYLFIAGMVFFSFPVFASETDGTIDAGNTYAFLCKNALCTTHSQVNFLTTHGNAVHITDTLVTGNAWSEDMGWINLNPNNNWVTNNAEGDLSGYAWGESSGWINFNPTHGGVNINTVGEFEGYAWAENFGWIKFDCNTSGACVKTDWRPFSVRTNGDTNTPNDDDTNQNQGSSGSYVFTQVTSPLVIQPPVQVPPASELPIDKIKEIKKEKSVEENNEEENTDIIDSVTTSNGERNFVNPEPKGSPSDVRPVTEEKKFVTGILKYTQKIVNDFAINTINFVEKVAVFIVSKMLNIFDTIYLFVKSLLS